MFNHKCIEAHNDGLAARDGDAATADGLVGEQFGGREIPRQGKQAIAPAAVQGYDTAVTGATTLENVELLVRVRLQWVKRAAAQRGVGLAERDELLVVGQQL